MGKQVPYDGDPVVEIRDRMRRVETRLTRYIEEQGIDTQAQRPEWRDGEIVAPTLDVSLRDCLDVVPHDWNRNHGVVITSDGERVALVYLR